jgi:hypothetical protein
VDHQVDSMTEYLDTPEVLTPSPGSAHPSRVEAKIHAFPNPNKRPVPEARPRDHGRLPHVHWYRWSAENPFGTCSIYTCRCGSVRAGF